MKEGKEMINEKLKLIKTHERDGKVAKVYRDSEWDEYRVKHYKNGKYLNKADYHTNDIEDAHDTAKLFLKEGTLKMSKEIKEGTAADTLAPNSMPADGKTKAGMMAAMMGAMNSMSKSELVDFFNASMAQFGPNADLGIPNGIAQKNLASITTKTVKEDVSEIFSGEELTEDFKDKVSTLIETAVKSRLELEISSLQEENEKIFNELVDDYKTELAEQIEEYLNFAVNEWVENNKAEKENSLKIEIQESFMNGLLTLFKEHYVDVPNEKYDLIGELQDKVKEIKEQLNKSINDNISLKSINEELNRNLIATEIASDLSESQVEKFISLTEGLSYSDLDNYKSKLETIKETYFSNKSVVRNTKEIMGVAPLSESEDQLENKLSGPMAVYAKAISKTVKS